MKSKDNKKQEIHKVDDPRKSADEMQRWENDHATAVEDMRFLLNSKQGLRFIRRLLSLTKSFANPKEASHMDTFFNLGAQEVGRYILTVAADVDPSWWPKLLHFEGINDDCD